MENKPYHHNSDGTFRNPEGSPTKTGSGKFSYKTFNEERKKIKSYHSHNKRKLLEIASNDGFFLEEFKKNKFFYNC